MLLCQGGEVFEDDRVEAPSQIPFEAADDFSV